jgi:thiamine pyrophosphokinase
MSGTVSRVVVVADGDVDAAALVRHAAAGADGEGPLVIAADGGALKAEAAGVTPAIVMGDGDSLDDASRARLEASGAVLRLVPAEKDETDTELCLLEAARRDAASIVLLGALGGPRIDHALANVSLLAMPELRGRDVAIEHAGGRLRLLGDGTEPAVAELHGAAGDLVSLLPLGEDVDGVTTDGLAYPLAGERLRLGRARGVSNVMTGHRATVTVASGRLLVHQETAR